MNCLASKFNNQGFVVIRNRLRSDIVPCAEPFYNALASRLPQGDSQCQEALYSYGNIFTESLLELMLPDIETYTGLALYPTYSYSRIYLKGAVLPKHTDRAACEVSVTVPLKLDEQSPWPIYLQTKTGTPKGIHLALGDYLIFRGTLLPHWREAYQGQRQVQAFLHYVDQQGPNAHLRYDSRDKLGTPLIHNTIAQTV
ncbi:hypothetical protein [Leptothoe spongobia]|uniref:Ferrochelatase n=1 Tax=Leptothoe spongobia TAU-MAC 1115 TaxID=1967444 RepID=A0A947DHA0_9CYAN|nr:hypothetical protein [Leptothoe spongobia]MBT9316895.1 hypothetical protein [Leptothoe spongobia TAU-MAC 1115]